ncbi:hypothetical protein [Agrobacterium tumefaciens]|uniref:hypothetical protein n=1 Tax=Agrobacterium tumefaciens TaxID=358 RepID=UPI001FAAF9CF|nr:hypothetical protein [Agrobacterium tumefaciens]UNZ52619.1 hypothetical protein MLE07_17725 [Agrobacterium tumefaciens]
MVKGSQSTDVAGADNPKTCFVMMPISDAEGYPVGHFAEVFSELIKPAVSEAGYECVLATSTGSAHMIQLEVVTKIATAPLCICDLSTNNPNVLFEYGLRQAFDLPTVLIKDDKTRRIFDLSGFRDIEYDHTLRIANILAARKNIVKAIDDTVDGAEDGQQVFSLVKLMNLTKAALPQGDVDPKDARFQLLERKLDGLADIIRMVATKGPYGTVSVPIGPDDYTNDAAFRYKDFQVSLRGGAILVQSGGNLYLFSDVEGLLEHDAVKALPPMIATKMLEKLRERAPHLFSVR